MKLLQAINGYARWKTLKVKSATAYGYDGYLRHFSVFLRNPDVEDITVENIVEYLTFCQEHGYKANTLEKYGVAIQGIIKYLSDSGYRVIKHELVPIPQKEYALPRIANEADFIKVVNAIPKPQFNTLHYYHIRNRAILWLLHDTGCRVGELLSSNIKSVDFEKMQIQVRTEKGRNYGDFRNLFWYNKQTTEALKEWYKKREEIDVKDEAVFVSLNGGVITNEKRIRRMDIGAVGEMMRKYSRLAKIGYTLNAHSFRHMLGRKLAERGANNTIISQVLGHKSLDSSRVYTNLYSEELGKAFRKIVRD
jgi:integrase/recombinase XerD